MVVYEGFETLAVEVGQILELDTDAAGFAVGVGCATYDRGTLDPIVDAGDAETQLEPCAEGQDTIGLQEGAVG